MTLLHSIISRRISAVVVLPLVLFSLSTLHAAETTPEYGIRDKGHSLHAFINATIVASPQTTYHNASLLVRDGRIVAVGEKITIPDEAQRHDLKGKTIYPGFIELFSEYGVEKGKRGRRSWDSAPKYEGDRQGADAWNNAIHSQRNWIDTFKPDADEAKQLARLGFTVAQSARLDGIFRGRGVIAALAPGLPNDVILKPYGHHFLSFDKGSSEQAYPSSLMGSIALIRQTLYDVDWYVKARAAFEKNPSQAMPEFNRGIEALANIGSEPILFEPGDELSLLRAHAIAREFGLKPVYLGSCFEYSIVKDLKEVGATVILPLNYPAAPYVKTPEDAIAVTSGDLRHWEIAPSNAKFLADAGVEFAFTSSKLKNKSDFWRNVRKAVRRGLPKESALAALTTVPARLAGVAELVGTLEPGKLAHFSVFDGDVLERDAQLHFVWIGKDQIRFDDIPLVDVRGTYDLTLERHKWELNIIGKLPRLRGTLKIGERRNRLQDVLLDGNKLQFVVELDTLGYEGYLRFSGRRTELSFSGTCALPDGSVTDWSAVLTRSTANDNDTNNSDSGWRDWDEKEDTTSGLPLLSKLTYPNKAYGVTAPPPLEDVLIKNATVWTSEPEGTLDNADVLVRGGKFAQIGRNLAVPTGARVIDATGKHITTGLIDEHSHIAISKGVNEGSEAVTSETRIGDVVNPEDISIYRILAGGVTMSQLLHGSANPIGAQAQVIKHKWGENADGLKYPYAPATIKFALGENVKQSNWGDKFTIRYPQSRMGVETIIKDAFQAAVEYEKEWSKYNALSRAEQQRTIPPRRDLELDAILEVVRSRMFIHCHSYHQTEILMLMRLAEEFGFRVQNFTHILEGYKVADEMREHGATANSFSDWWAYKFEVYDAIAYSPALMAERGVIVGINSDSPEMARRLNQEAGKSILYGNMPPEEAIKMVTINPAIQLKVDDRVGSIKVGKDADFVIWSDVPLSIYAVCEETWIEGRQYYSLDKDRRMRSQIAAERNALIQKALKTTKDERGDRWSREGYKEPERIYHCDDVHDVWREE